MSSYKVATGTGVALGSLTALDPQPRSTGVQVARRSVAADGSIVEEGLYIDLVWDVIETPAAYLTLLTTFGLEAAYTAAVTIYVPDSRFVYVRYDGLAVKPEIGRDVRQENFFVRNLSLLVKNLEASA